MNKGFLFLFLFLCLSLEMLRAKKQCIRRGRPPADTPASRARAQAAERKAQKQAYQAHPR